MRSSAHALLACVMFALPAARALAQTRASTPWAFAGPVGSYVPVSEADVRRLRREGAGAYVDGRLVFIDLRGEGALAQLADASGPLTIRTDDASLEPDEVRAALVALARRHDVALVLMSGATDAALAHASAWPRLRRIYVNAGQAHVTDAGLSHLRGLDLLEVLYLSNATRFGDAGLAHLAEARSLRVLELRDTRVGDAGVAHIAALTRLEELMLDGTAITDAGMVSLSRLTRLEALGLERTAIGDAGVAHLARLTRLRRLGLSQTQVGDGSVAVLRRLGRLERLGLRDARVTEEAAEALRAALPRLVALAY